MQFQSRFVFVSFYYFLSTGSWVMCPDAIVALKTSTHTCTLMHTHAWQHSGWKHIKNNSSRSTRRNAAASCPILPLYYHCCCCSRCCCCCSRCCLHCCFLCVSPAAEDFRLLSFVESDSTRFLLLPHILSWQVERVRPWVLNVLPAPSHTRLSALFYGRRKREGWGNCLSAPTLSKMKNKRPGNGEEAPPLTLFGSQPLLPLAGLS